MITSTLRIGLMGASKIGRSFAAGVKASSTVIAKGVASRNLASAKTFADETGIESAYGSYEEMLRDPDIDAVYISLPNGLHAEWSIRSVEAGKHVLCEKPLSVSAQEAVAMFTAARTAGVHLVEAYPYLAQPQTVAMRKMLGDGAVGRVRMINAHFGYSIQNPATDIRMSATLGGGALLDTGSYAISFARVVAGIRPLRVCANATWFSPGVDRTLTAMIEFPDGVLAHVGCSFETAFQRLAFVGGDAGAIMTNYANHGPVDGFLELQVKNGTQIHKPYETVRAPGADGFRVEAESFAALIAGSTEAWTGATPEESIDIAVTIDAVRRSLETGGWANITPLE